MKDRKEIRPVRQNYSNHFNKGRKECMHRFTAQTTIRPFAEAKYRSLSFSMC